MHARMLMHALSDAIAALIIDISNYLSMYQSLYTAAEATGGSRHNDLYGPRTTVWRRHTHEEAYAYYNQVLHGRGQAVYVHAKLKLQVTQSRSDVLAYMCSVAECIQRLPVCLYALTHV